MDARHEHRATLALCSACLALLGLGVWPGLTVRRVDVRPETPEITVAVTGAVHESGTYRLPWGTRVADLLERAGGLRADADRALVRPADPLTDGTTVVVPSVRTEEGGDRVSLNRAEAGELETLPGIGPALAARIVAARPFHDVDDLEAVRGIGPKAMERLRPLVTL